MVSVSKSSKKYLVPDALADVYDFANTLDLRCFSDHGVQRQTSDEIASADDLARWMVARRLIARDARLPSATHAAALALRTAIRDYLACAPEQRHHDRAVIAALNDAISRFPVVIRASSEAMTLDPARADAGAGLSAVVAALYDASANGSLARLKMCAAEDCRHVFFDRSKPGTRRWCRGALCGNRMKTRAYRARQQA